MPLPKFSSRYPDVREVLDYALAQGGARYTLSSPGQAKHWRARAYAFRKVLWGEINASGGSSPTPYDAVKITIQDSTCVIHIETASGRGKLEPLQRGELQAPAENPPDPDPFFSPLLEKEAEDLAKRLGLEL